MTNDEEEVITWLSRLRTNAIAVGNAELTANCEKATVVLAGLVVAMGHANWPDNAPITSDGEVRWPK